MSEKNVLIIDGQGGVLGKQLVEAIGKALPDVEIAAVGTNSIATANMLKAGAGSGATGENAVLVAVRHADIITGPIGIVIADSLMGEITPTMAVAVGSSDAIKILLPVNKCNNVIIGTDGVSRNGLIEQAVERIRQEVQAAR
jgi:hypothetical protein